jgi:hypothetical protein
VNDRIKSMNFSYRQNREKKALQFICLFNNAVAKLIILFSISVQWKEN